MKVCVFGNKGATTALLDHLLANGVEIAGLVTLNRGAQARVEISGADRHLAQRAAGQGIPVFEAETYKLSTKADRAIFAKGRFDIGLCTGWQRLIPQDILDAFPVGVFGWHGSGFRFPNGRGRSPLNWSLRLGLPIVYHNCFRYAAGVDDGAVFETEELPVAESDDIADLQARALAHIKASSLRLLARARAGELHLMPQIDHPFLTFPALTEASGFLSLTRLTAAEARNIARSCTRPFPGAFLRLNSGQRLRVWRLDAPDAAVPVPALTPGQAAVMDGRLLLHLRDGLLVSRDFEEIDAGTLADIPQGAPFACD